MNSRYIFLILCMCCVPGQCQYNASLQQAATESLGKREGTIIVLNPQNGEVLALVNPKSAFHELRPPGSTVKPFIALAALQYKLISADSKLSCNSPYKSHDYQASCVHRPNLPPFDVRAALGHSCNYFFAKIGERMTKHEFHAGLSPFGLANHLPKGNWRPRYAAGDSHAIQISPAKLIAAYAALGNGGMLFEIGKPSSFHKKYELNHIARSVVLEGMRGAVRYGTAHASGLKSLPFYVVGKTGTMLNGQGGEQGWFVGLGSLSEENLTPKEIEIAVLVYIKQGKGADSAAIAAPIFSVWGKNKASLNHTSSQTLNQVKQNHYTDFVRVKSVDSTYSRRLPLEEYILGVLSGEASWETEPEALKATAIAIRTFALGNMRRHGNEGFDFCTSTHCQRFVTEYNRVASKQLRIALEATRGMVLKDEKGQIVESYYSASCGGWSADKKRLWGSYTISYLKGQRDRACETGPHSDWKDVIGAKALAGALQSDPRTNTGGVLNEIGFKSDDTGRAETLILSGYSIKRVSGWDFKLIIGRTLGWNYLKSSRFTVKKSGSSFIFTGQGFGHGLGLCQEGAHNRALRGASYRQILKRYFPGTTISRK